MQNISTGRGIRNGNKRLAVLGSNHRTTLNYEIEIINKEGTQKIELAWPNERAKMIFWYLSRNPGGRQEILQESLWSIAAAWAQSSPSSGDATVKGILLSAYFTRGSLTACPYTWHLLGYSETKSQQKVFALCSHFNMKLLLFLVFLNIYIICFLDLKGF